MKVLFLTNEYPPYIYGGAGVHVDYLSRELAKAIDVDVRCFGDQRFEKGRLKVTGFELDTRDFTCPKPLQSVFGAVRRCTDFNTTNIDANLVHCHTWYSHFGGILAKLNYGIPLVITVHSLEPLRPWKREQLGGGYDFSLWIEKTALEMANAIVAVSNETKHDVERLFDVDPTRVHVIHNGIDLDEYRKVDSTAALKSSGATSGGTSLRLPYQLCLFERTEADVRLDVAAHLVVGEFQTGGEDERRLAKAELGRERVVFGPGGAGSDGLLGQVAPGGASLLPRTATTDDTLLNSVEARDERHVAVLAVALQRD